RAHDVALGDEAEHGDAVLAHDQRSDAFELHVPHRGVHRRVGPGRLHARALALENRSDAHDVTLRCYVCSSTTSPSLRRCSRPTCCPAKPDRPHTRAYFTVRARYLCTRRATSATVCPRRRTKGRSWVGGRPGAFV